MSGDMVERVARALCAEDGTNPDDLDSQGQIWWRCYIDDARAAIAAMREPTLDMEVAGTEQWLCEAAMEDRSKANWQAMIDSALAE
jgi:hypothetical protein